VIDQFPDLPESVRVERLSLPTGDEPVPTVLDTDTYNEIDDQFALIHALGAPGVDLRAVHAAPFDNARSSGPADGMERSYAEIGRLLDRAPAAPDVSSREGAERFMDGPRDEIESPATEDLVRRAEALDDDEGPLYVVAIGAATNVASALLVEPELADEIVVVWLGGPPTRWGHAREFNLAQDPHAARVLLDSGVPLIRVPTSTVSQFVRSTVPELRALLSGRSPLAEFLLERFVDYAPDDEPVWSKEIWDLAGTACLACPEAVTADPVASPVLAGGEDDLRWSRDPERHLGREMRTVDRDAVFVSFLDALDAVSGQG
jgi:inosine-uridine nucleoside N-ribohydrolase